MTVSFFKIFFFVSFVFSPLLANNSSVLVFGGKTGWIGKKIVKLLEESEHDVVCAESRLENRESILREIEEVNPIVIINCAGVTGVPNVDWCETHQIETVRTNIIGTLNLIDIAHSKNIHLTNFNTGCIYEYDEEHEMGSGIGFTEEDRPNFDGSFYSKTKILLEQLVLLYPNVLNLRVRMPISSQMEPKNFVAKITKYEKVINIPNSMTILDDLLPIAVDMTLKEVKGNFNFVNPGTLSHNEILDFYIEYVDPSFIYSNFTVEEQNRILVGKRSNNELSCKKLLELYPEIPEASRSIHRVFERMASEESVSD